MEFQSVHSLIAARALRDGSVLAACDGEVGLTYAALMGRAQGVAALVRSCGVAPGDVVAVCLERPLDQLVALVGVALSGAVWVPIAPQVSVTRAGTMLRQSGARLLLHDRTMTLPFAGGFATLDEVPQVGEGAAVVVDGEAAAAVVFVSKESGRAEGAVLTHAFVAGAVAFLGERLKVDVTRTLCVGEWFGCASLAVVLTTLCVGGTVFFCGADSGGRLGEQIGAVQACCVTLPLAMLVGAFAQDAQLPLAGVAQIVSFGEDVVVCEELRQYVKGFETRWHNFYGFPEMLFVTSLRAEGSGGDVRVTHVGRPAPQTHAFILDAALQLVPVGMPGELYVAGVGVCAGFVDGDALNGALFRDQVPQGEGRMYRVGCLARWLTNGRIEVLGRTDATVCVQGQRLALAEVEAVVGGHPAVQEYAAVVRRQATGEPWVTVFVVTREDLEFLDLAAYLAEYVGAFPVGFVQVSGLPRRGDGMVDREVLGRLTLLDSVQVRALEQMLRVLGGSDELVVTSTEALPEVLPFHVDEVLPRRARGGQAPTGAAVSSAEVPLDDSHPRAMSFGAVLLARDEPPLTLGEALLLAATRYPDHGVWYAHADARATFQSYPELLEDAMCILQGLRAAGAQPGGMLVFQFAENQDFIPAFWACMLGGFVPVPLSIPPRYEGGSAAVAKLVNAWALLDHPPVLTCRASSSALRAVFAEQGVADVAVWEMEVLRGGSADRAWHAVRPQDTALLLLTSGSTGVPKGVVLTHSSIIARSKATIQHNQFTSADVSLNWMPLDHVGGIVMYHICDVCLGARQMHARTEDVLVDPVLWLDLVERYRVTNTWAPNFAFALINDHHERVNAVQRDLSSLRFILNGGEAIQAKTAQAFLRLLRPHGLPPDAMHPAYGMSETCSGITFSGVFRLDSQAGIHELAQASLKGAIRAADAGSIAVSFVEVGEAIPGVGLRIVDQQNQVLPMGVVGRLQVCGPTVTQGYFRNPALNAEVFTDDGWFTTGDLAFLLDGRLTIAGREKDIIIMNGVNYHCHEIEAIVEEVEGVEVSYTAACALRTESGMTEEMVLFYVSRYAVFEEQLAQVERIRQAVVQRVGVNPSYVLPVPREAIPKTAIGKIQRSQLGQQFAAGVFAEVVQRIDRSLGNERTIPRWFFKTVWEPHALPVLRVRDEQRYVVIGEDGALARQVIGAFDERQWVHVMPGAMFGRLDERRYTVDLRCQADYDQVVAALCADGVRPTVFIHLVGYDPARVPIARLEELRGAQERGVLSVLALVQALARVSQEPTLLMVVTRYGQAVRAADPVAYEQATLIGLLKTIGLELGWLRCRHVDLEADDVAIVGAQVVDEVRVVHGEAEVAYRERQRLVPRLMPVGFSSPPRDVFVPQGVYMLTGGLGGVGVQVARWLAETYQVRLLVIGSTPLPDGLTGEPLSERAAKRLQSYRALQSSGAEFVYEALDISDVGQLRAAIARAEARWQVPLAGVLHFAGEGNLSYHWTVMDQHQVTVERRETFEMMFLPKVYGTWAVYEAVRDRPDVLVMTTSSVAGAFGAATFCAYAAANSFVDQFARYCRAQTHAQSVCLSWSQWHNVGMSANNPAPLQEISQARGYQVIGMAQGIASLLAVVSHGEGHVFIGLDGMSRLIRAQVGVTQVVPRSLRVYYQPQRVTLTRERVVQVVTQRYGEQPVEVCAIEVFPRDAAGAIDVARLGTLAQAALGEDAPAPIINDIERQLIPLWQEVLGRSNVGLHDNFFALGGHSLLATQLLSRLREMFRLEVRLHQLFEAPTVAEMAATIAQMQLESVDDASVAQMFAELEGLSEEEIARLLRD